MDQFQWGADLEPELFAFTIPTDFKFSENRKSEVRSKTDAQISFNEMKRTEPYLADYDALVLPDENGIILLGVEPSAAKDPMRLVTVEEIWQAQDAYIATWPVFDQVKERFGSDTDIVWVVQEEQKGTAHAVLCCKDPLKDFDGEVLILCGDGPLIRTETLKTLIEKQHADLSASVAGFDRQLSGA